MLSRVELTNCYKGLMTFKQFFNNFEVYSPVPITESWRFGILITRLSFVNFLE